MKKRGILIGIGIILLLCAALVYGFMRVAHSDKMAVYNNGHCSYFILKKNWHDAITTCSKSIEHHDQYMTGSYIRRAIAYRATGEVKEADEDAMVGSDRLLLALSDANSQDLNTIEPPAREEKPANAKVSDLITQAEALTISNTQKAEASLEQAAALEPQYPYTYRAWGELYTWQQNWDKAEEKYKKWADLSPKSWKPFAALGYMKYLAQDYAASNIYFAKAKALEAGSINLLTYRCDNFVHLSQWKAAVDECTQALAMNEARRPGKSEKRKKLHLDDSSRWYLDEEDYFLYTRRGIAYRALHQTDKADKDAEAADSLYVQRAAP